MSPPPISWALVESDLEHIAAQVRRAQVAAASRGEPTTTPPLAALDALEHLNTIELRVAELKRQLTQLAKEE